MLRIVLFATLIAGALAQYPNSIDSGYGAPGGRGAGGAGGAGGSGGGAPIESDPNLELENEGLNLPSNIVGQDLLDRVVDAVSRDLAEQEAAGNAARAAAAAASGAYGAPAGAGSAYGPPGNSYGAPEPSSQYGPGGRGSGGAGGPGIGGANGGADNYGQITLLIPPDPLKAKLIANYIQRTTGPYTPRDNGANNGNGQGYSNNGRAGGY
ncbi:unnamed protein product [Allacma fusca]|uniref:Uncharacterized protein n=1 Tax=Allacma fusca TaxID=39272 RepID=A0A8J2KX96_9HEXA|nr:unnamed protein product [Allacma fusca]